MNLSSIQIVNDRGIPFNVILRKTIPCGGCHTVVKIYDARYVNKRNRRGELIFGQDGQHVSDYYTKTFLEISDGSGLNMYGGISAWVLSGENVSEIKKFIRGNV